jgi:DNA-binding MarR family transcriptional regulator
MESSEELAIGVSAGLERLVRLLRSLVPAGGLSMSSAMVLSTLDRSGPSRLTALAEREGVTQPAMTQIVTRLEEAGLVSRGSDPDDGRVVRVSITPAGTAELARRRAARAQRLAGMLAGLSAADRRALVAAMPVIDALASRHPDDRNGA